MEISELYEIFLQCGRKVTTDSRTIKGGEIFWALKGETFDGNAFALKALQDGAAYCIVSEDSEAARQAVSGTEQVTESAWNHGKRIIAFPDTLNAIQELAAYHREHCLHDGRRIPVLGLTGTNGKTTTKELIRSVLSRKFNTLATEGNFNNNLGVPLTVLRLCPEHEIAIIEMGASHPGDIDELTAISHPDYALITNVGRAHLLGFGSFEWVKKTKGEMYDYVSEKGKAVCFINTDSQDLVEMAAQRKWKETVHYGITEDCVKILPTSPEHPFLSLKYGDNVIQTRLVGAYNTANVLAAIAVGKYFGVPQEDVLAALESYSPSNNRSQLAKTENNTVIIDAYNANPSSMACALENFAKMEADHKALMMGDMLELGNESQKEHRKIIIQAASLNPECVIMVGGEFKSAFESLTAESSSGRKKDSSSGGIAKDSWQCFATSDEAAAYLHSKPLKGYAVLLKGSRGTRMEKILPEL